MTPLAKLTPDNHFVFVCQCGVTKELELPRRRTKVNVTCKCGEKTNVNLCSRQTHRKATNIDALLNKGLRVMIVDMSENGYKIRPNHAHPLKLGQKYNLSYTLPDKQQTEIHEVVEIVRATKTDYGLKIEDKPYSKSKRAKGFWLRPVNND